MQEPRLYILMRNDMASMTAGRACAQAAHAQSEFEKYIKNSPNEGWGQHNLEKDYNKWKQNYNFGTVIVLAVDYKQLYTTLINLGGYSYASGEVIDPEYSVTDGLYTHKIPDVLTCAWVFCDKEFAEEIFKDLRLY